MSTSVRPWSNSHHGRVWSSGPWDGEYGRRRVETLRIRSAYPGAGRPTRFGVAKYWIVDPELERVRVLHREGLALVQVAELERDDRFGSPLLPGFDLALADVFG